MSSCQEPRTYETPFLDSMPRCALQVRGHEVLSALYLFTEAETIIGTL